VRLLKNLTLVIFCLNSFVCWAQVSKPNSFEYTVDGFVYFDENLNGFREGYDFGIGGVRIYLPDGQIIVSDRNGYYKGVFVSTKEVSQIQVDKNSVPPGAIFTSPKEYFVSQKTGSVRSFVFGLHYPIKESILEKKLTLDKPIVETKEKQQFIIRRDGEIVYINEEIWQNYNERVSAPTVEKEFILDFKILPVSINEDHFQNIIEYLNVYKAPLKKIDVILSIKNDSETSDEISKIKAKSVLTEIKLRFLKESFDITLIDSKIVTGDPLLKVKLSFQSTSEKCLINFRDKKQSLDNGKYLSFDYENKQESGEIHCFGHKGVFTAPLIQKNNVAETIVKKSKELNPGKSSIRLTHSLYLEESRDLNLFFKGKSDFKDLALLGSSEKITNAKTFSLVYKAKSGKNTLNFTGQQIGGEKENLSKTFYIFPKPKWNILFSESYSQKSSKSTGFNSSYTLSPFTQYSFSISHMFNDKWGGSIKYKSDLGKTAIPTFTQDKVFVKHEDMYVHLIRGFSSQVNSYDATLIYLKFGLFKKSFNPGGTSVVNYGMDLLGPHILGEFHFREVSPQFLDMKTRFAIGVDLNPANGQVLFVSHSFLFWLNKLGALFGTNHHYNFYERYNYLHNTYFLLDFYAQYSNIKTEGISASVTSDLILGVNFGLDFTLF
jgi:hypothetical protein